LRSAADLSRISHPTYRGSCMTRGKRIYVLATNVLMHDPTSLFRSEERGAFIPMTVPEELDAAKKGQSEVSRNARQVSRFINELIENDKQRKIADGLALRLPQGLRLEQNPKVGRLHFQTLANENGNGKKRGLPDNLILASVVALRDAHPDVPVVLVTKDINLRIKASIAGITAEDYENDRALDDFSLLYAGHNELPADFWEQHPELRSWSERGHTYYEVTVSENEDRNPHQFLYLTGENEVELRVLSLGNGKAILQIVDDYFTGSHTIWGIQARNREQNFALNALMDPEVDFVSLLGTAGTGK